MDIDELTLSNFFYSIFIKHPEEQNMTDFEHFKFKRLHRLSYL